jgi:hypothetical protein
MENTQEAELRNPFPSLPSHYTNYTGAAHTNSCRCTENAQRGTLLQN